MQDTDYLYVNKPEQPISARSSKRPEFDQWRQNIDNISGIVTFSKA
jgi:hypothetical protein